MQKQLFYILSLLFFPMVSFSQIIITGQVVDADGSPIELATIAVFSSENEFIKGDLTDETGSFVIEVNKGHYTIQITYLQSILYKLWYNRS